MAGGDVWAGQGADGVSCHVVGFRTVPGRGLLPTFSQRSGRPRCRSDGAPESGDRCRDYAPPIKTWMYAGRSTSTVVSPVIVASHSDVHRSGGPVCRMWM